jgi:basic amino acid/polyamine antiporter, APA family
LATADRSSAELVRALGPWDAALLTVGSVLGSGIFLVSSDIARILPHGGLLLAVWVAGGLLALAGALTYAEMGAMLPHAGGVYLFLREAWGPRVAFLYGWAAFWIIMSGGLAALAVGFGHYLGGFLPWFAPEHLLARASLGGFVWTLSGAQVAGAAAILGLSAINHFGVQAGATTQNLLTGVKLAAFGAFCLLGFLAPARAAVELGAPLPAGSIATGFGLAMIAALWTFDGWYGATFSAGEMRDPGRTLPLGLAAGTVAVTLLYLLLNAVYLRALPLSEMAEASRVGEAAASALFGAGAGRLLAAAILVSIFGCLAATLLYSSRIYAPMARDGVFFPALARVHSRWRVPTAALWSQSLWAVVLALSGTYEQLYTYVTFAVVLFNIAAGLAIFRLRRLRPDLPRPFRVPLWPWLSAAFVAACAVLAFNTLLERPVESILGLLLLAAGLPAFSFFRARSRRRGSELAGQREENAPPR